MNYTEIKDKTSQKFNLLTPDEIRDFKLELVL